MDVCGPTVQLHYVVAGEPHWQEFIMAPEEYFEPADAYEWDSTPVHPHACDYLDVPTTKIQQTVLRIYDRSERLRIVVTEFLWNQGFNRLIESVEDGDSLLVVQVVVREQPRTIHTIRLDRGSAHTALLEHFLAVTGTENVSTLVHAMTISQLREDDGVA